MNLVSQTLGPIDPARTGITETRIGGARTEVEPMSEPTRGLQWRFLVQAALTYLSPIEPDDGDLSPARRSTPAS